MLFWGTWHDRLAGWQAWRNRAGGRQPGCGEGGGLKHLCLCLSLLLLLSALSLISMGDFRQSSVKRNRTCRRKEGRRQESCLGWAVRLGTGTGSGGWAGSSSVCLGLCLAIFSVSDSTPCGCLELPTTFLPTLLSATIVPNPENPSSTHYFAALSLPPRQCTPGNKTTPGCLLLAVFLHTHTHIWLMAWLVACAGLAFGTVMVFALFHKNLKRSLL